MAPLANPLMYRLMNVDVPHMRLRGELSERLRNAGLGLWGWSACPFCPCGDGVPVHFAHLVNGIAQWVVEPNEHPQCVHPVLHLSFPTLGRTEVGIP